MINAKICYECGERSFPEITVQGVIGAVYGQYMFFYTVDAMYRLKVVEDHEPDPETGETASWNPLKLSDDRSILFIEIAEQVYEVLSRVPR